MLIIKRRNNESFVIPALDIKITVLDAKPNRVVLGIDAPKEVVVRREEVHKRNLEMQTPPAGLTTDAPASGLTPPKDIIGKGPQSYCAGCGKNLADPHSVSLCPGCQLTAEASIKGRTLPNVSR